MRNRLTIGALLAMLALVACQGGGAVPQSAGKIGLVNFGDGLTPQGVTLVSQGSQVTLQFAGLPAGGQLLHLDLPAGQAIASAAWSETTAVLQVIAPTTGGADIGVVPLPGYTGAALTLKLTCGSPAAHASALDPAPPSGQGNKLFDLALEQGGAGQVRLSWTEVNQGDYDFNGIVNLSDLTVLGQLFRATATGGPEERNYWVDGDHNGEINAGDLTVIAQHYNSAVDGYTVLRNGTAVPGPNGLLPTVPRVQAEPRLHLPPHYTAVLDGSPVDSWSVVPTYSGATGSGNDVPPLPLDLSVKLTSTGLPLHDLDGSTVGPDPAGRSRVRIVSADDLMRIIDPIDTPYSAEIGSGLGQTTANAGFNGLPRGQWVLAQILLAPSVDPATGGPLVWDAEHPHYVALHVPVLLPPGTAAAQLSVSATFKKGTGGRYTVRVASLLKSNKQFATTALLDFAGRQVSADTNNDGVFTDEFWLSDPRLCGLSTARLQQLVDYNAYVGGTSEPASLDGRYFTLDQPNGKLTTSGTQQNLPPPAANRGTLTTLFNELTTVNQLYITTAGSLTQEIAAAELQAGDKLQLTGYVLKQAGHGDQLWVTGITRVLDVSKPDKLYAFPDKTSVYPGEEVSISLISEQSASPFYALQGVRVTYNNADYVPNSFNAGAPGGAREAVDGLWTQLGATTLDVPQENTIQQFTLPDGRTAVDFYVRPLDGAEIPNATGQLLSFKLSVLGSVTLGIQRLDAGGIKRSFYTDGSALEHYWSDDYNSGVPMITVEDPGGPGGP